MKNNRAYNVSFIAFIVSLAGLMGLLAFAWGFASAKFEFFPYRQIREMEASAQSLSALLELRLDSRSAHEIRAPAKEGGITINRLAESADPPIESS